MRIKPSSSLWGLLILLIVGFNFCSRFCNVVWRITNLYALSQLRSFFHITLQVLFYFFVLIMSKIFIHIFGCHCVAKRNRYLLHVLFCACEPLRRKTLLPDSSFFLLCAFEDNSYWAEITYEYNDTSCFFLWLLLFFAVVIHFNCQSGWRKEEENKIEY